MLVSGGVAQREALAHLAEWAAEEVDVSIEMLVRSERMLADLVGFGPVDDPSVVVDVVLLGEEQEELRARICTLGVLESRMGVWWCQLHAIARREELVGSVALWAA